MSASDLAAAPSDLGLSWVSLMPRHVRRRRVVGALVVSDDRRRLVLVDSASRILFSATAGTTYHISVGAYPTDPVSQSQGEFGLEWGDPDLYDQDNPVIQLASKTALKHGFRLTFATGDKTGNIVGPGWVTTECKVDGGPFGPCTSPWTASGLTGGTHTWTIRATDNAGNVGTLSGTAKAKGSSRTTG
jgi:hypothetical protein